MENEGIMALPMEAPMSQQEPMVVSSAGRQPDALLKDAAGRIIGGVYDTDVVYF